MKITRTQRRLTHFSWALPVVMLALTSIFAASCGPKHHSVKVEFGRRVAPPKTVSSAVEFIAEGRQGKRAHSSREDAKVSAPVILTTKLQGKRTRGTYRGSPTQQESDQPGERLSP